MSKVGAVTAQDQVQGNADAEHTLVEYGDYECPSCGQALPLIKKVQKHFGTGLRFVFRNYPLDQHEFAEAAAETAEFAAEKGKFWEMHDLLYKHQDEFSEELFPKLAAKLGLDEDELAKALESGKYAARVKKDVASGDAAGVRGTPSFYLDGKVLDASDYEGFVAAIEGK